MLSVVGFLMTLTPASDGTTEVNYTIQEACTGLSGSNLTLCTQDAGLRDCIGFLSDLEAGKDVRATRISDGTDSTDQFAQNCRDLLFLSGFETDE